MKVFQELRDVMDRLVAKEIGGLTVFLDYLASMERQFLVRTVTRDIPVLMAIQDCQVSREKGEETVSQECLE